MPFSRVAPTFFPAIVPAAATVVAMLTAAPALASVEVEIVANVTTEVRSVTSVAGQMQCAGHGPNQSFTIPAGQSVRCVFTDQVGRTDVFFQLETVGQRCVFSTIAAPDGAAEVRKYGNTEETGIACDYTEVEARRVVVN